MHPNETRKSLASQIDRLDAMLDNLAEGINGTVVAAVQEAVGQAVRQAVQAAIKEVLANTVLQERLRSAAVPAAPGGSGVVHGVRRVGRWLTGVTKGACSSTYAAFWWLCSTTKKVVRESVLAVQDYARRICRRGRALVRGLWLGSLRLSRRVCAVAVVALAIALILGIVAFTAGPFLTSLLNTFVTQVLVLATLVRRHVPGTSEAGSGKAAA